MGVRTKEWGRHGWIILHSISAYLDMIPWNSSHLIPAFLNTLPCVHCRKCSTTFISEVRDLSRQRVVIYDLHTHVNQRLFRQDIANALENKKDPTSVMRKWSRYQPVLKKIKHIPMLSRKFTQHLIEYMYYALTDYEAVREWAFDVVFTFLSSVYMYQFDNSKWSSSEITIRLAEWNRFEAYLFQSHIIARPLPIGHRVLMCKKSQVGC